MNTFILRGMLTALWSSTIVLTSFSPVSAMDREMEIKATPSMTIQIHPKHTLSEGLLTYFSQKLSPEDLLKSLLDQPINLPGTKNEAFFPMRFAEYIITRQTPLQCIQLWRQIVRTEEGLNQEKNQVLWMMNALQGKKPPYFISFEEDKGKTLKAGQDRLTAIEHEQGNLHEIIILLRNFWKQCSMDIQHLLNEGFTVEQIMSGPFVHLKLTAGKRLVTQRILELLAHNTSLLSLDINPHRNHLLSPKELGMLGYALKSNRTLQVLGFDAHDITVPELTRTFTQYFADKNLEIAQPLLDALSSSHPLKSLRL